MGEMNKKDKAKAKALEDRERRLREHGRKTSDGWNAWGKYVKATGTWGTPPPAFF